jgi:hypothetical protein
VSNTDVKPSNLALLGSYLSSSSRARRLEDRICTLCAKALKAKDPVEVDTILEDLSTALRDHVERIRQRASGASIVAERRRS